MTTRCVHGGGGGVEQNKRTGKWANGGSDGGVQFSDGWKAAHQTFWSRRRSLWGCVRQRRGETTKLNCTKVSIPRGVEILVGSSVSWNHKIKLQVGKKSGKNPGKKKKKGKT